MNEASRNTSLISFTNRLPAILTTIYVVFYLFVLAENVYHSTGDQTDVIRTGAAAFPLGLLLSIAYPGERDGAFMAVSIAAALNAVCIYFLSRRLIRRLREGPEPKPRIWP